MAPFTSENPTGLRAERGFTLIEVLVALTVLAIGLLGIAGLQARSLRDTHTAYLRSQATLLTSEIIDRMRANRAVLDDNYAIYNLSMSAAVPSSPPNCVGTSVTCSRTDIATYDQAEWLNRIARFLPLGDGSVDCNSSMICTVTVSWDEQRTGSANTSFVTSTQL